MRFYLLGAAAIALSAAAIAQAPSGKVSDLKGPGGAVIGKVTVTEAPRGVILRIEATGLAPGWHGAHFHEKGDCGDAAYKNSGGHVHGGSTPPVHGLLNPAANDSGDLPNLFVKGDGTVTAELYSTLVSAKPGTSVPALYDADGSALVIHAKADDYTTQPIGGAGDRVACAVIK